MFVIEKISPWLGITSATIQSDMIITILSFLQCHGKLHICAYKDIQSGITITSIIMINIILLKLLL